MINEEINTQTVIRTYSGKGAKELFDVLERRKADLETVMRPIKGFVSYTAAHNSDESVQKARDWITKNAASTGAAAPKISEGSVVIHV
jgi:hypothetical protein